MLLATTTSVPRGSANDLWDARFFVSGIQGEVYAIATRDNEIFAGGKLTAADGVIVSNIAHWNGMNWAALAGGVDGDVNALAIRGNEVFVGGTFLQAGGLNASRIARWDGTKWCALGVGIEGQRVTALVVDTNGILFAAGEFSSAGGVEANNIARWDGTNWSALGTGLSNDPYPAWVLALAVHGTDLYAGGFFTDAGGVNVSCTAKWNGTTWSALGAGVDDRDYLPQVTALAVRGNDLYVGGAFTLAGNMTAAHVAQWNGTSWSALGAGLTRFFGDIPVTTLAVSGEDLLVGGRFEMAGGASANNLARWDGATWSEFGGGASGTIKAIGIGTNAVHAAGSFTVTNSSRLFGLAQWNVAGWSNVSVASGQGVYGSRPLSGSRLGAGVAALAVSGSSVFAAGGFSLAGELSVTNIARWDGTNWWPLGLGVNGPVFALALSGNTLFAGGQFYSAGGVLATNIARWDGTSWLPVGAGVGGPIHALAVRGNELYAGGVFTSAGGTTASNIARWNGANWSAFGSGVNGTVYALAAQGTNLYVGGKFTLAGGVSASNIAAWNGIQWSALAGGVSGVVNPLVRFRPPPVSAMAVTGSNLYVGGDFALAGGVGATNIAKWDGTRWWPVGDGIFSAAGLAPPPTIAALLVHDHQLYAGGTFVKAGKNAVASIARWDGQRWNALGDGISVGIYSPPSVQALIASGDKLYVGGHFNFAGEKPASDFSIWQIPQQLRITRLGGSVQLLWPTAAQNYTLQYSDSLSPPAWRDTINASVVASDQSYVIEPSASTNRFYRLIKR